MTSAQAGLALTLDPKIYASARERMFPIPERKCWVWTGIDGKATSADLKTKYEGLKSHGIHGVFLGGGIDDREFAAVREAGLELHTWMWTTNRGDEWIMKNHPDWYMVSRSGKSCFDQPPYVNYYRWVSPVIPGVQSFLEDQVHKLASHPHVNGVHLDYVRYPDVILPKALWKKYNLVQTYEMADYDFCYSPNTRKAFEEFCGRDPLKIEDPAHDQQWLHFRYDSVHKLVEKLAKVAHREHKLITAAVFPTPARARTICRQGWDEWPLDAACPMTYASFYERGVDFIGECTLDGIHAAKFPIYSGIYMPDVPAPEDFRAAIRSALDNGAAGVSLFGGIDDAHWPIFEAEIGK